MAKLREMNKPSPGKDVDRHAHSKMVFVGMQRNSEFLDNNSQ